MTKKCGWKSTGKKSTAADSTKFTKDSKGAIVPVTGKNQTIYAPVYSAVTKICTAASDIRLKENIEKYIKKILQISMLILKTDVELLI